ncbi:hypothetical protein [Ktedonospora formicarum]|uniref:hypothetical protein n=1 Tax=Ktedonospora formicarum TaxID=2778364 RepID=UPI001F429A85|nr:hypothetical protein [Ktedonospora formicarum]
MSEIHSIELDVTEIGFTQIYILLYMLTPPTIPSPLSGQSELLFVRHPIPFFGLVPLKRYASGRKTTLAPQTLRMSFCLPHYPQ